MNTQTKKRPCKTAAFAFMLLLLPLLRTFDSAFAFTTPSTNIRFKTNEITTLTEIATQIKKDVPPNADTEVTMTSPLLVEIKGYLPVILIPIREGVTDIKLNPPTYKEAIQSYGQTEMSQILSHLMIEIQTIQKQLQKREYAKAMEKVEQLQGRFPELPFLNFVKGSILLLQGKKSEARQVVRKALDSHPDYEEGRSFLKSLGEEPPPLTPQSSSDAPSSSAPSSPTPTGGSSE